MKAIVIWTGDGYVGHKGGAHMQTGAEPNRSQLWGDDPAEVYEELLPGEYMVWVDIEFGDKVRFKKGTQNEE